MSSFGSFNYSNIESMDKINVDGLHLDYFPLFFDQDTANRITKALDALGAEFYPTFYKEVDKKLKLCTKGAAWFVDYNAHRSARDWTYSICEDHVNGIGAREMMGVLRDLRDLITNFTGRHYNAVMVRQFKHGEDHTSWSSNSDPWLGKRFDTPCMSFGAMRKLEFRKHIDCIPPRIHKKDNAAQRELKREEQVKNQKASKQEYPLPSGSLIIMKDGSQRLWQHRITYDEDIYETSYHLIFRNVQPNLIHKQYQKYPKIVDRRSPRALEDQWKKDNRIESNKEENVDKQMYNKSDVGVAEKEIKKEAEVATKGLLETITETAAGWFTSPVKKPPGLFRKPVMPIERQISSVVGTTRQPIRTLTAEQLEIKVKEETGRDIHIPYNKRPKRSKRSKRSKRYGNSKTKTVVVDLTQIPEAPINNENATKKDQSSAIKRIYHQLLPIKEIDPTLFDKLMRKASNNIKKVTNKNDLIAEETKTIQRVTEFRNKAIEGIKEQGLISEKEFQEWSI